MDDYQGDSSRSRNIMRGWHRPTDVDSEFYRGKLRNWTGCLRSCLCSSHGLWPAARSCVPGVYQRAHVSNHVFWIDTCGYEDIWLPVNSMACYKFLCLGPHPGSRFSRGKGRCSCCSRVDGALCGRASGDAKIDQWASGPNTWDGRTSATFTSVDEVLLVAIHSYPSCYPSYPCVRQPVTLIAETLPMIKRLMSFGPSVSCFWCSITILQR